MQNTRKLNVTYSEGVPCASYKGIFGSGNKFQTPQPRRGIEVGSFTPRPLHSQGKSRRTPSNERMGVLHRQQVKFTEEEIILPQPGNESRFLSCPNRLLFTVSAVTICLACQQKVW